MGLLRLLILATVIASCAVNNDQIDGPVYCEISQTDTYQLGQDPSSNFNVTNLVRTRVFNETDCPNINNDSFDAFVTRAKRQGTQLQIFWNQYTANQYLLEFEVAGTDLLPLRQSVNINNCSIIRNWNGTLNPGPNTVTINEFVTYKGACQSTFYNEDLDTTNPGG
jgi:hypothetical protein